MLRTKRFRSANAHLAHLTCNVLFLLRRLNSVDLGLFTILRHVRPSTRSVISRFFSCDQVLSLAYLSTDLARYAGLVPYESRLTSS